MAFLDYYAILCIPVGATAEQIERAYKRLVSISHPDVFPNDPQAQAWANERMKQINEAYDVLKNPAKRADYDREYRTWHEEQQRTRSGPRQQAQEPRVQCPLCEGTGEVVCLTCQGRGDWSCPGCGGSQTVVCPICAGAGSITHAEYERLREEVERAEAQARARQRAEEETQRQRVEAERRTAEEEAARRAEFERRRQAETGRRLVGSGAAVVGVILLLRACGSLGGSTSAVVPLPRSTVTSPSKATPGPHATIIGRATPSTNSEEYEQFRSLESRIPTTVTFSNRSNRSVRVLWVDYQGREVLYRRLGPGESYSQPTFATHPWRIRDASSGKVLRTVVAREGPITVAIPSAARRRPSPSAPRIPPPPPIEPAPVIPGPPP